MHPQIGSISNNAYLFVNNNSTNHLNVTVMTEFKNAGAAPVSKYAAKKARLNANEKANVERKYYKKVETADANAEEKPKDGIPESARMYPTHIVRIALIIKNNAEIRRFTALGILNYLQQKGEIDADARGKYVGFKWNKFSVKANGLMREYPYTEPFFLTAFVASFTSFSANAQKTINDFCKKEMSVNISKAVDAEEVDEIVAANQKHIDAQPDDSANEADEADKDE